MLIAGRHFSEEILTLIRSRVEGDPALTRTALSREVCTWMEWQGADGQPKDMRAPLKIQFSSQYGVTRKKLSLTYQLYAAL
ncbi:hypothetical protein NTG1052_100002 [Candidatus Nitrotoga sp. 1052]|nr:hypothetical protein NTG1052_100002 [Candidatus Nitrotoga sp. 1052]